MAMTYDKKWDAERLAARNGYGLVWDSKLPNTVSLIQDEVAVEGEDLYCGTVDSVIAFLRNIERTGMEF